MLRNFRNRIGDERGFTLIELLVVILIIGILAAIAIPSFINQKGKGDDAAAKSYARNAQTAEETYFTDNNAYTNAIANLTAIEATLGQYPNGAAPTLAATAPPNPTYSITVVSKSGVSYIVSRAGTGLVTRTCTVPAGTNRGGCPASGNW
jgi:type IV pilus assembly protein PilA